MAKGLLYWKTKAASGAASGARITLSPLRDNSAIQLVFHALRSLKAKKD